MYMVWFVLQTGLSPLHLTAQEEKVSAAEVLAKHDANLDQQTKVKLNKIYLKNSKYIGECKIFKILIKTLIFVLPSF